MTLSRPMILLVCAFFTLRVAGAPELEEYGKLPRVSQMVISPNADLIAYRLTGSDDEDFVRVYSLKNKENVSLFRVDEIDPQYLQFSSSEFLVLVATEHVDSRKYTHTFDAGTAYAYDIKRNKVRPLVKLGESVSGNRQIYPAQSIGNIVGTSNDGHEIFIGAFVADSDTDNSPRYSLLRVKSNGKGKPQSTTNGSSFVRNYFLDGDDRPIARIERNERKNTHTVRAYDDRNWRKVYEYESEITTHSFLGLTADFRSLVFLRDDQEQLHYYTLSLFDGEVGLLEDREVEKDIERVLYDKRRVVIGVQYAGITPSYRMFETELDKRVQNILATFPEHVVYLSDWSPDLEHILVRVEGSQYAGDYVLFSKGQKPTWVAAMRRGITREDINPLSIIEVTSRDGLKIPTILTLPLSKLDSLTNLPTIMLPHGGPAAHDVAGFDFMAQALATRGYLVVQPQFRGSSGFGRAHLTAGYGEWGRKMQDDLADALGMLIEEGISDPERTCIAGASYGGYAALAGAAFSPNLYKCALSIAGISHLSELIKADKSRYGKNSWVMPYLERSILGGEFNEEALKKISPFYAADQVQIPVLLMHGEDDKIVDFDQSRMMHRALKKAGKDVELIRLKDEDHYLSEGSTRMQTLEAMVTFIDKHIGDES